MKKIGRVLTLFFILYLFFHNWFAKPKEELMQHIIALIISIISTILIFILIRSIVSKGTRIKDIIKNQNK